MKKCKRLLSLLLVLGLSLGSLTVFTITEAPSNPNSLWGTGDATGGSENTDKEGQGDTGYKPPEGALTGKVIWTCQVVSGDCVKQNGVITTDTAVWGALREQSLSAAVTNKLCWLKGKTVPGNSGPTITNIIAGAGGGWGTKDGSFGTNLQPAYGVDGSFKLTPKLDRSDFAECMANVSALCSALGYSGIDPANALVIFAPIFVWVDDSGNVVDSYTSSIHHWAEGTTKLRERATAIFGEDGEVTWTNVINKDHPEGVQVTTAVACFGTGLCPTPDGILPPPPIMTNADTTFTLFEWELNHVFDSLNLHIEEAQAKDYAYVNSSIFTLDTHNVGLPCGHDTGQKHYDHDTKSYEINLTVGNSDGDSITKHPNASGNNELRNKIFPQVGVASYTALRDGAEVNTTTLEHNGYMDFGFNLMRSMFKDTAGINDIRTLAKFVSSNNGKDSYAVDTLGMKYDLTPPDSIAKAGLPERTKRTQLGDINTDVFNWRATFKETGETVAHYHVDDECSYTWTTTSKGADGKDHTDTHYCKHAFKNDATKSVGFEAEGSGGSNCFFTVGTATNVREHDMTITSKCYKYLTSYIPTGSSPKSGQTILSAAYSKSKNTFSPNTDGNGILYKRAMVQSTSTTLSFYPEVKMTLQNPARSTETVTTVGELKRSITSPMLMIYRIDKDGGMSGTVYSDTSVGGTSSKSSGNTALTAGGDFTVKTDTNGIVIKTFGYALDIVDSGDGALYSQLANSQDIKTAWGNSGSRESLLSFYKTWATSLTSARNYGADYEMYLNGKYYNNFNTSVGRISSSNPRESGNTYTVTVENGVVTPSGDLLDQLGEDYQGSGQEVWNASGFADAILDAIEERTDADNKSGTATYNDGNEILNTDGTDSAATISGSNWYDEQVHTIVVRRYETNAAHVQDIIAQDKMDIGTASESLGSNYSGQFGLTLYFKNPGGMYCMSDDVVYKPKATGDNNEASRTSLDIVINHLHVDGADFTVTQSTTATGRDR